MDIYRVGETKRLAHAVTSDDAFAVSAVAITIRDSTGTAVVSAGAGAADPGTSATEQEVFYNHTPAAAGDFTYLLAYTVGAQTIEIRGAFTVLPASSLYETSGYFSRVLRALADNDVDEDQLQLTPRDLMDSLAVAYQAVSVTRPQRLQADVTMDGTNWEFDLGDLDGWDYEFSQIERIEPRVDTALQYRYYLPPSGYETDLRRGKWRYLWWRGSAGDVSRLDYTGLHVLTHTTDTLPSSLFEAVCLYAAGHLCGAPKANRAASTEAPEQGAGLVSRRDQTARYQAQSDRLKREARALWKRRDWSC